MDKKSQHVGNHGGVYTDMDGQTKQFTYVDHDVKPKVSFNSPVKAEENMKIWRTDLIERITTITPAYCPELYRDFVIRGEGHSKLEWNKTMLSDEGIDIVRLQFLCNQIENKVDLIAQGITP